MKLKPFQFLACLIAFVIPAVAGPADLPSNGLGQRIEFWKKVYTLYGADDNIVHDRYDVDLIYDVVGDDDVKGRIQDVQTALSEIRAKLSTEEALSPMEIGRAHV